MSRGQYLEEQLERALRLQRNNDFRSAIEVYTEVTKASPAHGRALYLLGFCYLQIGEAQKAISCLDRVISLSPRIPQAFTARGAAYKAIGDNNRALLDFERALDLTPDSGDAEFNKANTLRALKRLDEAAQSYRRATQLEPKRTDILNNLAGTLSELGDWPAAASIFSQILAITTTADSYYNLGVAKSKIGQFAEAATCFTCALQLKPDYAEAFNGRGHALAELGEYLNSAEDCMRAISIKPQLIDAYVNCGKSLTQLKRHEEALAIYDDALDLNAEHTPTLFNRGVTLRQLGRLDEAEAHYRQVTELDPSDQEAKYARAHLLLHMEKYEEGFSLYKGRWEAPSFPGTYLNTTVPEWDGQPFSGNLLLWAEQGIGDEIFYASLLSLLPDSAMQVTLAADKRLHPAFARSFPNIRLIDRSMQAELATYYDAQAPIGDLGRLLKVDPFRLEQRRYPFLAPDRSRSREYLRSWRARDGRPRVGVSWKSSNRKTGPERSIDLLQMAPILKCPDVVFINLQYGDVKADIADLNRSTGLLVEDIESLDTFRDLDGLLAVIDACDLVVTIDNVTAHLAGSIGKTTIVLVPCGRGEIWYWQGKSVSNWYPSVELIYQKRSGEWGDVVQAAANRMESILLAQKQFAQERTAETK